MSIENTKPEVIPTESDKKISRTPYFVAMFIEIVLLYVVNNILQNNVTALAPYVTNTYPGFIVKSVNALASLKVSFMTIEFTSCLWAVNLAITFAILGNLALTLYHPRWFHHLMKGLLLGIAILPVYVILRLFPFEFGTLTPANVTRIVLITIMSGLALGFIVRLAFFIKYFLLNLKSEKKKSRSDLEPPPDPMPVRSSEPLRKESSDPTNSQPLR
jgi:hypothetical protein